MTTEASLKIRIPDDVAEGPAFEEEVAHGVQMISVFMTMFAVEKLGRFTIVDSSGKEHPLAVGPELAALYRKKRALTINYLGVS